MDDLGTNDWVLKEFDTVLPRERSRYLRSRQIKDDIPYDFFTSVQEWTVVASLVVLALFIPYLWKRRPIKIMGLGGVIVFTLVVNAFVTGVLSGVEERYQNRVMWLLPFLAALLILYWQDQRKQASVS